MSAEGFRLSPQQERVWRLQQEGADSPYRAQCAVLIEGRLDRAALEAAVRAVVRRHEILRTSCVRMPGMTLPVQVITDSGIRWSEDRDLAGLDPAAVEARIESLLNGGSPASFDLESGEVLQASVAEVSEERSVLFLRLPALCADGPTLRLLTREISRSYDERVNGRSADDDEPVQYPDLAEWQNQLLEGDETATERAYWRQQDTSGLTGLRLPSENGIGGDALGREPERRVRPFPRELQQAIEHGAAALGVSTPAFLLAAWQALLGRLTGRSSMTVGTFCDGRTYDELRSALGPLARYLPLTCAVGEDEPFADVLRRVHATLDDAPRWQEYFSWERPHPAGGGNGTPYFPFGFDYEDTAERHVAGGVAFSIYRQYARTDRFKVRLAAVRRGDGIVAEFHYDPGLFAAADIERLAEQFVRLLRSAVDDPSRPTGQLEIIGEAERHELLVLANATAAEYPAGRCFHELFREQAARAPEARAVVFGGRSVTYAELDLRSDRLARYLIGTGVGPDVLVGLCLDRGIELVVSILAVLKAGGAYLPLDPSYPAERLAFMLEDARAPVLVTEQRQLDRLPGSGYRVVRVDVDRDVIAAAGDAAPIDRAVPENLAYVIYTSGSTGRPKGAMIQHQGLVNYLHWCTRAYAVGDGKGVPVHSPVGFDLTVTSLLAPLYAGQATVLLPEDQGAEELAQALADGGDFSLVKLTPSHLKVLAQRLSPEQAGGRARAFVIGGEALLGEHLAFWQKHAQGTRLINEYGPTETVVGCCIYDATDAACGSGAVPIGKPIANTRVYLLDSAMNPVPAGVAGELFVGGAGVCRGYLARPGLTAERFVPDPFGGEPGARMYRTGDLCRRLPDGNLEFIGRIDQQVKIRGYRVELGEIEAALKRVPGVREAALVARAGKDGERRLVAYVVGSDGAAPTSNELRRALQQSLPDSMVPSTFVALDALPLTVNGKLDRAALPEPGTARPELTRSYVAPSTPVEQQLAAIWADLLGLERVGIEDNFFELGGDSILSIQVVSRAKQAGLAVTPQQVFQNQTIAELARVTGSGAAVVAEQGPVTGPVHLLPVQRWLLEQDLPEPQHYNQSVLLTVDEPLDPVRLERALGRLVEHHDALRLRFIRGADGWSQHGTGLDAGGTHVRFEVHDLRGLGPSGAVAALTARAEEIQAGFVLDAGPLLGVALFGMPDGSERLLIAAHHLVIDGVSWRILLEDLLLAYEQVALPPKTTSYREWATRLEALAGSTAVLAEADYWRRVVLDPPPGLPTDRPGIPEAASAEVVETWLEATETEALLRELPTVYRTQINDVLLAALGLALRRFTGGAELLVDLEGHGREDRFDDVDLSRTVGWFTTIFPVRLAVDPDASPGTLLKSVKEQLRTVPGKGLAFGLLRLASPADMSFNYLGRFDAALPAAAPIRPAREDAGRPHSARGRRAHVLDFNAGVDGDRLRMTWRYSANLHDRSTIERLAGGYREALHELIEHCLSPEAGGCTPTDFPLAGLDQATLDRLVGRDREIEDVYPAAPVQAGMLFHSLLDPDSGVYFEQVSCRLKGRVDARAFRDAWQQAVERHPILRTGFAWDGVPRPMQVVRRQAGIPWEEHDLSNLTPAEQDERIDELLAADRRRGFDLGRPPLMRLALIHLSAESSCLVWSHHHLVLDGWSLATLLKEVLLAYEGAVRGVALAIERTRPYRDYVAWLASSDRARAEEFWRKTLHGFDTPTPLAIERAVAPAEEPDTHREEQLLLSPETTAALDRLSRGHQLTLNTIVQGAFGLLLARYSGERDVVYGTTVSGRAAGLAGIESMLGLFINTLPVRVRVEPSAPALDWLAGLQEQQGEMREHEATPLVDVHGWSDVPRGTALFESLLVFENYPVDKALRRRESTLDVSDVRYVERTNYPLTVIVAPGERLGLRIGYATRRFEAASVRRMLEHLRVLLECLAEHPERRVSELSLLPRAERRSVLELFNDTATDAASEPSVQRAVERQAARTPDRVAVALGERELTYRELNERANRLAGHLRGLGIGPDSVVAVCVERSPELVLGLLAVLKAGAAYLPLDPAYPEQRLAFMLEDSAASVLLTSRALAETLPVRVPHTFRLDADWPTVADLPASDPPACGSPENLAYVIYTSGSTGTPKGVAMPHRALVNLLAWQSGQSAGREGCRTLQFASPSFDVSFQEVFSTLSTGGTLVLCDEELRRDPQALLERMDAERVERLFLPFVALQHLAQAAAEHGGWPASLSEVITAGEQLQITPSIARVFDRDRVTLHNQYGPTETHVVTAFALDGSPASWPALPPIGRPVANCRVYILDADGEPVPIGVSGELYLGGVAVARGYLHRPGMTAERFVPDPFGAEPGARLYRTGDLCRFRPDGNVEYLGRMDQQVKVRGFRIELGEIEALLGRFSGVRDVAVALRDQRLVAYVVPANGASLGPAELSAHLAAQLPEHMLPAAYVFLDALPLSPNGKVDRKRLPAPDGSRPDLAATYVAPRTPTEERLVAIWSEVLGVQRVGVHDGFFDLGGHSLLATQLVSRVRQAFEVELPLRALFEAPTVARLAEAIERAGRGLAAPPIVAVPRTDVVPLSFAQERIWFLDQLVPDSPFYNMPVAVRIRGALDAGVLGRSFEEIARRHEALRATFRNDGGRPVLVTLPEVRLEVPVVAAREEDVARLAREEALRPFDLAAGPLVRLRLLQLDAADHVLLLTLHHIVADGWSLGVLVQELGHLYPALAAGRPSPLPELPVQYADFAAWQRRWLTSEVLERQLDFWRVQLADLPVLDLPTDRPRPALQKRRGATHSFELSAGLSARLKALSESENASLFMTLLAAFQTLLGRYSGQDDVVVGTNIANRNRAEIEGLIGFFINSLALRTDLSGDPAFRDVLGRVRHVCLAAYEHQDLPFERLIQELEPDRDLSRESLFQTVFVLQNLPLPEAVLPGGLALEPLQLGSETAKTDLVLSMYERGGRLAGGLEYNTDLFDAATARRIVGHFETLLAAIVERPDSPISELPILQPAERRQLLEGWNDTVRKGGPAGALHELFEAQVGRTPGATAVVFDGQRLTYAELNRQANRLAHHLQALGVGPESLVGILMERSPELVAAIFGVLKAGAAYVPLDPDYPQDRLRYMVEDARMPVLLTHGGIDAAWVETATRVVRVDDEATSFAERPWTNPGRAVSAANTAYVIYTSGSTGRPKGVAIGHGAICNHMIWMQERFPLTAEDRVLQKTPISFDASVWEFYAPLLAGGTLVLAEPRRHADVVYLVRAVAEQGVTVLQLVPTLLRLLLEEPRLSACKRLRRVFCGGEALSPELQARFFDRMDAQLCNLYGPTEATIDSVYWVCERGGNRRGVPIGRPVRNLRAYVLDATFEPVPVGVPGELFLSGAGLGRGYVGRPGLTAEKFVPDPFAPEPGQRMYRTADRCRRLADGTIEFLGRVDEQIKFRGVRIEPGEIEAALREHPAVRDAAVAMHRDRLVGYCVGSGPLPEASDLRAFLHGRLPDSMVPSSFIVLDALPLTPSGKLDRHALPASAPVPMEVASEPAVGPSRPASAVEQRLIELWRELLGVEAIGVESSFFEIGGHSLLATQLVSRIRDAFGVELPLYAVFESATVAEMAREVETLRSASPADTTSRPIERVPREGHLPLSFAQQRLWFLDQLLPGSASYNMPSAVRLTGELSIPLIERTFSTILERHEALRTTFETIDGRPVQRIALAGPFQLPVEDLGALSRQEQQAEVARRVAAEARAPFDLARGPLIRIRLLRLADREHVLLTTLHHIVADGWSFGVLLREFAAIHAAFAHSLPSPLPELPVQYVDFADWQRRFMAGEVLDAQVEYWREQLADLPVLQLPTDRPRPAVQTFRGRTVSFELPAGLASAIKQLSDAHGATPFMTYLAAFQVLLARYSGQEDIAVGSPIANRNRKETEGLIGFFVNNLVLRGDLSGDPAFLELLGRTRHTALEAYAHQDVPFEKLVEELAPTRNLSREPLFQVMFGLQNVPLPELRLPGGLTLEPLESPGGESKFDLTLMLWERAGRLSGSVEYNTDLFDPTTIDRLVEHYRVLLEGVVAGPERAISEIPLLDAAERGRVLVEWNRTAAEYARETCIHTLFEQQVERAPGAVALQYEGREWTYRQLDQQANQLAHYLQEAGVGPETIVALSVERSPEMVVAVLGVLKAGGAYLSIDPDYPRERIDYMLEDSGAALHLTHALLERDREHVARQPVEPPASRVTSHNLAYVIYTSGSTGRPKGTLLTHEGLANLTRFQRRRFGAGVGSRVLQFASPSYDASVWECFMALANGATLGLAPAERLQPGPDLAELLREQRTTIVTLPPSILALLAPEGLDTLRTVIVAGERCPADLVERWAPGRQFYNAYGPTETTVCATVAHCEATGDRRDPSIGGPLDNLQVYVLDRAAEPVPVGVPGELCVGGAGLARGYLGRPGLTAERFVPHPFAEEPGARLYRTGDLCRWRPDGTIEFLGRIDQQVKLRGIRIELGEIEAALAEHPAVQQALVVAREDRPGDRRLVAYHVGGPEPGELRSFLGQRLPEHMLPAAFVALSAFPLTRNGKIDRPRLPAPDFAVRERVYVAPRTPAEERLAAIWREVLGVERVGMHDGFFELGGHSLLAAQLVSRVREAFGVELPLRRLFESATVAGLAEALGQSTGAPAAPPVVSVDRTGPLPLSFAQERLWFLDQLVPGGSFYNLPLAVRVRGRLDLAALERSFAEIVRRHEALRTTFTSIEGRAVQVVGPPRPVELPLADLSHAAPEEREARIRGLVREEAARPFDIGSGSLIRAGLIRADETDHVLLVTLHHIVADGWSMGVFVREVAALYAAFSAGLPSPLPELRVQYADFAHWQRSWLAGEVLESQVAYWRNQLADLPLLDLPTDRPRPAVRTFHGATERFEIPAALVGELRGIGEGENATPFMTLLAAFQILLGRYSGQEDVVVGSPIANRRGAETEGLIGFFVNTLVLRGNLAGNPTFRELIARVREVCLGAYAHQDLPYEKLVDGLSVERDLSRESLFQVMFVLQNLPRAAVELPGGLSLRPLAQEGTTAKFDLTLGLEEVEGRLAGVFEFNTDLFDRTTIERMAAGFAQVLAAVAAAPDRPLSELPLLPAAEHEQLEGWSRSEAQVLDIGPVHQSFARAARAHPEALAVADGTSEIRYGELDARANRLARHLLQLGVGPETRVALLFGRSIDLVVGALGVLKAGGAYVPLDPAYPDQRLQLLLHDSRAAVLLTSSSLAGRLPADGVRVVCLDTQSALLSEGSGEDPGIVVHPDRLAYVIYTSGSTGRPKGVEVPHAGLSNLVGWHLAEYGVTRGDRATLIAGPAFDASVWEMWPYLAAGASLHLPDEATRSMPADLALWLASRGITLCFLPTPLAEAALDQPWPATMPLRALLTGGDRLHRAPRRGLPFRLVNHYGPTENSVVATFGDVVPESAGAPSIGRPIGGTRVHLLDRRLRRVPVGAPGELCIGGASLARGYFERPGLTAECFVADPFSEHPGARLYRTGDRCRYLADGRIEFLGRIDEQVKIRGVRIEPAEVEAVLGEHPDLRETAVLARADAPGERRLVAYVVPRADREGELNIEGLRRYLRDRLPDALVPSAFVVLDALPLTPNGKLDRRALPAPERRHDEHREFEAPATAVETALARVWSEVLGIEHVGIHDNFFELGGDSILAIQIVHHAREAGLPLSPQQVFQHQTVAELARALGQGQVAQAEQGLVRGEVPLTPVQRWFFEGDVAEPHHFNQALMIETPQRLDPERAHRVVAHLLGHHDALRLRFARQGSTWRQENAGVDPDGVFEHLDFSHVPDEELSKTIERHAAQVQTEIDLASGRLMRVVYFDCGQTRRGRLLLVTHHLAVDGVSWRLLTQDFTTAYLQLVQGAESITLPPKTTSFRYWAERLAVHARTKVVREEAAWWIARAEGAGPALPRDRASGENVVASTRTLSVALDEDETRDLLQLVPRAMGTRIDEVLTAALARAIGEWTGNDRVSLDIEGHGREPIFDDVDLTRTVGWFTTIYPVHLALGGNAEPRTVLAAVSDQLRTIPGRGIGYGLLRYLSDDPELVRKLAELPQPEVIFNYLGQADRGVVGGPAPVGTARESAGGERSPRARRAHLLEVSAAVAGRRFQTSWTYSENFHDDSTLEQLARTFLETLRSIVGAARTVDLPQGSAATERATATTAPSPLLVPLGGNGSEPPFFCVHQTQGLALSYLPLARHLGHRRFYGVQSAGLFGEAEPSRTLEQMAESYIDALRTVQPHGPYHIGGHSFGGHVAYEMAQQLHAKGERVALLAMIDTAAPGFDVAERQELGERDDARYLVWLAETVQRLAGIDLEVTEEELRALDPEAQLERFMQRARKAHEAGAARTATADARMLLEVMLAGGVPMLRGTLHVARINGAAHLTYVARPYPGRVTLFRSTRGVPGRTTPLPDDPSMGWNALAAQGTEIRTVPGDHQSIVAEPEVGELARQLAACLERTQSETRDEP